ncbi:histidine kinase N-terminal 7TM domain-containing protein [Haloferax sp. ATB1]|uniref:histidine kinase N-terminal 7TM domain-containing protein n=1 Tax=Haloferax sp. ATB1 TaxID=1508454 RepID=UPI0005B217B8|nr:histidine kinase N-terminal 7TM domain-containing protein [Haloferax sp. ATB1]
MLGPGLFHVLLLSLAALVTGGLAGNAWRHRDVPGARSLSAAMVAVTAWTATEILALSQTGASHLFWERVQWAPITVAPIFFFFFIARFTGYEWVLSRRTIPLYFVLPVLSVILIWTNPAHGIMWTDPVQTHTGGIVTLSQDFGIGFWIYFVYAYSLLIIGFILLIRLVTFSQYLYLDQTILVVLGILAPLAGNALSVFGITPLPGMDLTPYGFTITGIAFGNALFRYRLFELLPATRQLGRQEALVDLKDGVVIVDPERNILYLNPAASDILDCVDDEILGGQIGSLIDTDELDFTTTDRLAELSLNGRTYEVETAPIRDQRDEPVGYTVLLYDVTERIRREEELRAQRDRFQQLEGINTVIRNVNQVLVSSTTVEELQWAVVETLATPELYDDVWFSTSATTGPPVRMRVDDTKPSAVESEDRLPVLKAIDTIDSVDEDMPDHSGLADGGNWTSIPLVYGQTVYGAIALHTTRETGFGERELDVLDELGETIGHALTSIERTHLLVSDTRIEIDIQSTDSDALLVALSSSTDTEWVLDGLIPARNGDLTAYLSTEEIDAGIDEAKAHRGVLDVRQLSTDSGTTLEVQASHGTLAHSFVEYGANVRTATATDGRCQMTVELSPGTNVRAVVERVQDEFPATELLAKRDVEPSDHDAIPSETDMTDRQREALEAAFRAGYFDWPRDSTAEEVAASLDISSATLHGHLRKAENRLLSTFFGE